MAHCNTNACLTGFIPSSHGSFTANKQQSSWASRTAFRPAFTTSFQPTSMPISRCRVAGVSALKMSSMAIPSPNKSSSGPEPHIKEKKISPIGLLFLLITYLWAMVIFPIMMVVHPFVRLFDEKRRRVQNFFSALWAKVSMASVGIVPQIIGRENLPERGESAIYIANHNSYIDIYTLCFLNRGPKFVSKIEILNIPIIGWAMRLTKHVCLQRSDRRGQVEAYRNMLQTLRDGNSLALFPEGTRSKDGKLRKFQSGAFKASKATNIPIVPITIVGTRDMMPPSSYLPIRYPPRGIQIIIHPRVYPDDKTDEELKNICFDMMNSALPVEFQSSRELAESPSTSIQ